MITGRSKDSARKGSDDESDPTKDAVGCPFRTYRRLPVLKRDCTFGAGSLAVPSNPARSVADFDHAAHLAIKVYYMRIIIRWLRTELACKARRVRHR
jgi:hypothetical protein